VPAMHDYVYEVFDIAQEKVIARIPVEGEPHNTVISPDGRYAYLLPQNARTPEEAKALGLPESVNRNIVVVDTGTQEVVKKIPIGAPPHPGTISKDGKRFYQTYGGHAGFGIFDLEAGKMIGKGDVVLEPGDEKVRAQEGNQYQVVTHGIIL